MKFCDIPNGEAVMCRINPLTVQRMEDDHPHFFLTELHPFTSILAHKTVIGEGTSFSPIHTYRVSVEFLTTELGLTLPRKTGYLYVPRTYLILEMVDGTPVEVDEQGEITKAIPL